MLNLETVNVLTHTAQETRTTVKVPVGTGVTKGGAPTTLYASFRLPVRALSATEVVKILRDRLPNTTFPVSLPRITDGEIVISVRSVYAGKDLAALLVSTFGVIAPPAEGKGEEKVSKGKKGKASEPLAIASAAEAVDGPVS